MVLLIYVYNDNINVITNIFLYHKPLVTVGFIEVKIDLPFACYLAKELDFFIVTPRMFTFSLQNVESDERLLLL